MLILTLSGFELNKQYESKLDVRGSVHHSIIHEENPTRCSSVSKFLFHVYM